MNNTWYGPLLSNFPGLALVSSLDGSILYCSDRTHHLLASENRYLTAKKIDDVFDCKLFGARVIALQRCLGDSVAESEILHPENISGMSAPVHMSVYLASVDGEEPVVVTQIFALAHLANADSLVVGTVDPDKQDNRLLEKRYKVLTALNDVTVRMMDHQPLNVLLQNMAELVLELTSASSSFIHIVKGEDEWLELVAMSGISVATLGQRLEKGVGLAGQAWLSGQVEYVEDYQRFTARVSGLANITQACALPMIIGDRVVGVLGIMYADFREAIVDQLDLLHHFSTLASIAVENAMLMENTRNELIRNKTMHDLGAVVFKTDSFEELLETTAEAVLAIVGGGSFDVWHLDTTGGLHSVGGWLSREDKTSHLPIERPIECVEEDRQVVLRWLSENPLIEQAEVHMQASVALQELLDNTHDSVRNYFIPCFSSDGEQYIFHVAIAEGCIFTESIKSLLCAVGNQFSIAAHRQSLQREVNFQAYHDGLTALPNRIQFDQSLKEVLALAKKSDQKFSVLFIDLDGFKLINDSMGHETGDKLLAAVAQRFRRVLDDSWVLARIGGDEFAVIITFHTDTATVIGAGNRLLESLHGGFSFNKHAPVVGASIGVAIYPSDGATASDLLRNADLAMYEAKRNGKNRVYLFGDLDFDPNNWLPEHRNVA